MPLAAPSVTHRPGRAATAPGATYAAAVAEAARRLEEWHDIPFFSNALPIILDALKSETRPILPPAADVFNALLPRGPDGVKVVILGQDPYPTPGHANGLAFSVAPDVAPLPRSLANIFRELEADLGSRPACGDLSFWAQQGVLLLNTVLTVPAGEAGGHRKLGWQRLAGEILQRLDEHPRAFLLWGRDAARLAARHLVRDHHLRIETPHPSPLSARRGFFGARPFSRVNRWLEARGERPIDWTGSSEGRAHE